jgi:hypothetical protein
MNYPYTNHTDNNQLALSSQNDAERPGESQLTPDSSSTLLSAQATESAEPRPPTFSATEQDGDQGFIVFTA